MVEKVNLIEELDKLFTDLLTEATQKPTAGALGNEKVNIETKLEIGKEVARWIAIKNKLPEPDDGTKQPAKPSRLSTIREGIASGRRR